jgi:hypothetical protein
MTGIVVLWRQSDAPRASEVLHRAFHGHTGPHGLSVDYDVDINGETVVVCTSPRGSSERTAGQVTLIKQLLLGESAKAPAIVEFHWDLCVDAPSESFENHRSEGVVEGSETTDHYDELNY